MPLIERHPEKVVFESDGSATPTSRLQVSGADSELLVTVASETVILPRDEALRLRDAISEHFANYGPVFDALLDEALETYVGAMGERNVGSDLIDRAYNDDRSALAELRAIFIRDAVHKSREQNDRQ